MINVISSITLIDFSYIQLKYQTVFDKSELKKNCETTISNLTLTWYSKNVKLSLSEKLFCNF